MVQQVHKLATQQTSPCKLDGPTMKRMLFALLCGVAIVAAQGRTLRQANETAASPAADAGPAARTNTTGGAAPTSGAPANTSGGGFAPLTAASNSNRTFAKAIEAANIPANITFMINVLDAAFDNDLYDFGPPSTILVPTDAAWREVLDAIGLNTTDIQELAGLERVVVRGASLAIILYHELPFVILTSNNITDGQSFPTSLEGGGNITVFKSPAGNITFAGDVNVTAGETPAGNNATVLYPDILVNGTGVLLHIVDTVLAPPQDAWAETTVGLTALIGLVTGDINGTDASGAGGGNATSSGAPAAGAGNGTAP